MFSKTLLITLGLLLGATTVESKKVCRALALSGGANKGAYEMGVLKGLTQLLPAEEYAWDVVTGVSAGAINAGGMSIFPVGMEKEMVEFMQAILENLQTEYIYTYWDGPIGTGFFEAGFFNDTPMQTFLENILN